MRDALKRMQCRPSLGCWQSSLHLLPCQLKLLECLEPMPATTNFCTLYSNFSAFMQTSVPFHIPSKTNLFHVPYTYSQGITISSIYTVFLPHFFACVWKCVNFQLWLGEETIWLPCVDGLQRLIFKVCAVYLACSSCCADVSMGICIRRISRYLHYHGWLQEWCFGNLVRKQRSKVSHIYGYLQCAGSVWMFI